jgi:hypothetical protein
VMNKPVGALTAPAPERFDVFASVKSEPRPSTPAVEEEMSRVMARSFVV